MSEVNRIRRARRFVMCGGAAVVLMSYVGSASAAGILPGNFLPNPDMETETRFTAHQIEGPTVNSFADYWHHSLWAGWNAPGEPVLSGQHSLRLVDEVDTTGGPFADPNGSVPPQDGTLQQQEFRTFATNIPVDAVSPTGLAETLYFRWNWNYQIDSGSTPEFVMNVRFSNAPNFSLDLGPSLGDNFTVVTGSSNGLWEEVNTALAVPAGALTFDILFLTEGSPDALGFMFIDDVSVSTIAPVVTLVGDLDGDGFVGINDLNIVLGNWNLNVPPANPLADPSGDGFVGIDDLNTVLGNWNAGTPPAAGAVPEPTTLVVLGLGGLALLRRRA